MEVLVYIIIGIAIGAISVFFFLSRKLSALRLIDADRSATLKLGRLGAQVDASGAVPY